MSIPLSSTFAKELNNLKPKCDKIHQKLNYSKKISNFHEKFERDFIEIIIIQK